MIKDKFPLPLIEEVLDKLENSKVYTSLDLKNGFFHVPMVPNSTKYTSFVTHEGQYEFLRVPFGLSNSPSVFQRFIYTVFRKFIRDNILIVYMDERERERDLLIPSQNEAGGLNKLRLVLQTAADFGLELNLKKCNFLQRKIEFLGYIIENGTIKPSPSKTQVVQNFPQPQTPRQLQSFIGLTSYFRKFIPNYARIARPLSDLLRDNVKFKFGPTEIASFQELEKHSFREPSPPCFSTSRKTAVKQEKYSSYELEVLAIIEALKKFRSYLLAIKIKHLLEDELSEQFINKRNTLRNEAKENILRLQDENKKQYNKHRKRAYNYKPGDTVAIQRTQFGTGLKLRPKYFGPYEVTKVNKHDRYEVQKIDNMKVQMSPQLQLIK
ncbi:retrovirus-related Pol polyprotein from transposon 297 [Trichonephila clavipes]|nr:retrovirus-related Pol polyprotein from transposon 297 [Trichonephila clavipes]